MLPTHEEGLGNTLGLQYQSKRLRPLLSKTAEPVEDARPHMTASRLTTKAGVRIISLICIRVHHLKLLWNFSSAIYRTTYLA